MLSARSVSRLALRFFGILVGSTLAGSAFRLPFVPDRSSCAPELGLWSSIHADPCALAWTYFIFSEALVLRCGLTQPLGFYLQRLAVAGFQMGGQ